MCPSFYKIEFEGGYGFNGWGGRIRTSESRFQRPVSYRLTTPQSLTKLNPKLEYRNPCLRRSGFAQAGETNPTINTQNFFFLSNIWVLSISACFEFGISCFELVLKGETVRLQNQPSSSPDPIRYFLIGFQCILFI
jgi:hypothetical protein